MKYKQIELFENESGWKTIFHMALPAMVTMLVMILYNLADMFFIGLLGDHTLVAAVALCSPVFTFIMAIGSMLGGGGCALIARSLGEKNAEKAKCYSSLCFWASMIFGVCVMLTIMFFENSIIVSLGSKEDAKEQTGTYLRILCLGAPAMIFTSAFGSVIRAEGAVKESMVGNLLATATNIFLDPLFILAFKWGVGGAAIATVLGNLVGSGYLLNYLFRTNTNLTISVRHALQDPAKLFEIMSVGLPNAISSLLSGTASALGNNLLSQYGTVAIAANAASGKSTMVISMIQMGLCMGVQPLIAYHYGNRNLPRIREALWKMAILTVSIGSGLTILCYFCSDSVVGLFLKENFEALALGQKMMRIRILTGPIIGLFYIGSSFMQASGNAKLAAFTSMLRQAIFLIPLLYIMNKISGITGNIWAHVVADFLSAVVALLLLIWQYRELEHAIASEKIKG